MQSYKQFDNRIFQFLMRHGLIFVKEAMIFKHFFRQILISIKYGEISEILQVCN